MTTRTPTIRSQRELRRLFWDQHPQLDRRKIADYAGTGTMYRTDTRCAWTDWIDMLSKCGAISEALASRATLEGR